MKNKGIFKLVLFISILALAGISCGVSNIGNLFATATPTPTSTFTPTPTFTPSPTSTSTPTATPTATPLPTGVVMEEQSDGSMLFVDYDNKYRLILSAEWVAIPFDQDELGALVKELSKDNPQFEDAAAAFKNLDPDMFRLVALNQNPDYFQNGAAPNVTISAIDNDVLAAMPLSFVTGALEQSFKDGGTKVVTTGVNTIDNQHGVEVEFLEIEQEVNGIKIAQRVIVFQANKKLIMITFTSPESIKTDIFTSSDLTGGSIELFE